LLARKRSTQLLSVFLSAVLAWPSYVTFGPTEPERPVVGHSALKSDRVGSSFQHRDGKGMVVDGGWSDLADDLEGSDGRDKWLFAHWPFSLSPHDLPSLVPSTSEFLRVGSIDRLASFERSCPLRC
jgi:hypothetical protein